jgi:ParB family chromosome partitioning protein
MATVTVNKAALEVLRIEPQVTQVLRVQNIRIDSVRVGRRMRSLGDVNALIASIRELGLLNPITVTRDRLLVSGLHRLAAFKVLGRCTIPAVVLTLGRDEAQLCEIDENLARNDLNLLERAEHLCLRKEIYERLHPETRRGGDYGNQHIGGKSRLNDNLSFSRSAATFTGQSSRTVQRLVRIANLLTPETRRLLRGTDWADNQRTLLKLCKLLPDIQESVARKVAGGESKEIYDAIARVHRDRLASKPCSLPLHGEDYHLLHGDFRKVGHEVPSGSVDLILTDAPYESRYLDLFEPLSLFASRVLRDGGSLVVMMGQSYLPQVMNDLSAHLQYHWIIATLLGQRRTLIQSRRVCVAFKPLLWFVKGKYRGRAVQDVIRSDGSDKNFHDHGQSESEFAEVIKRLTEEGAMVLDPFVGGGSVAAAALMLGRKFIGIDIDRKHIETARRRIEEVAKGLVTI